MMSKPFSATSTSSQKASQNVRSELPQLAPKLYLITNDDDFAILKQKLTTALASGVIGVLQIRRKQLLAQADGQKRLIEQASELVALAQDFSVEVVINDDMMLASQLGVGVHLGQSDGSVKEARRKLGQKALIGRTCHQAQALVTAAKLEGASYAALGAIFPSPTKPQAAVISPQQLAKGCQQDIDICVIGGITADNALTLNHLPIKYIAVVSDILGCRMDQIAARCQQWQQVLASWQS